MSQPVLEAQQLVQRYGGLVALDGVSLRLEPGERKVIIGPNGAGKTTLFRVLSGEVQPTSGRVLLEGADVTRLPAHRRTHLGMARTYQVTNLFLSMTVAENLAIAVAGTRRRQALAPFRPLFALPGVSAEVERLVQTVGLAGREQVVVAELSYGEQRQLEVGMALASRPKLLLLDEPTAGLSAAETEHMVGMLRRLPGEVAILLIEHDMDVALSFGEKVMVMHRGRVLMEGPPDQVRADREVRAIYLGE